MSTEKKFLTAPKVAALCGVDLKTLHNWARADKIPHFRTPGNHLRFSKEQVAQILNQLESAGIRGATAGTTLKNMFTQLEAPPSDAGKALQKLNIKIDHGFPAVFEEKVEVADD